MSDTAKSYHHHLGILYGLAAATNAEMARVSAMRVESLHVEEIEELVEQLATLRDQLAVLPTPDDMRVLALGHRNLGGLSPKDFERYMTIERRIIEQWSPKPETDAIPTPTPDPELESAILRAIGAENYATIPTPEPSPDQGEE